MPQAGNALDETAKAPVTATVPWQWVVTEFVRKLAPQVQWKKPAIFAVYVGSITATLLWIDVLRGGRPDALAGFILAIALWLWSMVLFANGAEALAEGLGKAQADALRAARRSVFANVLSEPNREASSYPCASNELRAGMVVLVEAGEIIPADGEIIEGVASIDESAITGDSAPVILEAGAYLSSVTGGTKVLSDWIIVRVTADPGEAFLDRMIATVEGAKRGKTPNERALTILLVTLALIFLSAFTIIIPFSRFGADEMENMTVLMALLVCLIPTTIGAPLSAIGIASMSHMMRANVLASSGRAIEAAGDVDVLLLDKTGTITLGKREARTFIAAPEVREIVLANAAQLASLADETPEGRSIVFLAKEQFNIQGRSVEGGEPVAFSARTRMSGINIGPRQIRKGAADAIMAHVQALGGVFPVEVQAKVEEVARRGSTPLVVSDDKDVLGMIELKDIVKGEMQKRCADFRRIGIKTIMITGDNRLTAAAIAAEAGVDHYLAEATPEDKLRLIWEQQAQGHFVATTGGCTNDAPALAQADVAVAMNRGTQAAKEAGNMVDLDNNPLKLFKVVDVGKQMIMTRNALTTFSVANDIAKYVAIVPAALVVTYPQLGALNIMRLHSPTSAILSAVVFNALIIIALIPLALNGVKYRAKPGDRRLARNLLIYGGSGVIAPFIGIKLIDLVLSPFM